jgi:hypothetical protein
VRRRPRRRCTRAASSCRSACGARTVRPVRDQGVELIGNHRHRRRVGAAIVGRRSRAACRPRRASALRRRRRRPATSRPWSRGGAGSGSGARAEVARCRPLGAGARPRRVVQRALATSRLEQSGASRAGCCCRPSRLPSARDGCTTLWLAPGAAGARARRVARGLPPRTAAGRPPREFAGAPAVFTPVRAGSLYNAARPDSQRSPAGCVYDQRALRRRKLRNLALADRAAGQLLLRRCHELIVRRASLE